MKINFNKGQFVVIILILLRSAFCDVKHEIYDLTEKIVAEYQKKSPAILFKKKLAILNLKNLSENLTAYEVGSAVSSIITEKMSDSLIFTLVERENINKVLNEIKFGLAGLTDEKTAPRAGELLGAELLLDGNVSELGENISVEVRLLSTQTGEIYISKSIILPKNEIILEASNILESAFQSRYGISLSVSSGIFVYTLKGYSGNSPIMSVSADLSYRFDKNLNFGIGYCSIAANEIIREKFDYAGNTGMYRNYNFFGFGPKLFLGGTLSPFRWLNSGIKVEYIPGANDKLTQDISNFPVYVPTGTSNQLIRQRTIVDSFSSGRFGVQLLNVLASFDFLISSRLSINITTGWCFSDDYIPIVYESKGHRQWNDSAGEQNKIDEPDADLNGTFAEYQNFNFARFGVNGDRVKLNFSGLILKFGLSVHF